MDVILYVVRAGCAWRALPAAFPPWQTVYWYFNRWEQQKVTEQILPIVRRQLRAGEGRNPEPSAGIIDSQSVKSANTVGQDSHGFDAGKKINGRKRFVSADAGSAGRLLDWAATILKTTVEVVRKPPEQRGFAVLTRRWVVERTPAWLTAHRRPVQDSERHPAASEAMIRWAAITTITRRIARGTPAARQQKYVFTPRLDLLKHALSHREHRATVGTVLLEEGAQVRALTRPRTGHGLPERAEVVVADAQSGLVAVAAALDGGTGVCLNSDVTGPATGRFLNAAVRVGVGHIVLISSVCVDKQRNAPEQRDAIALMHRANEELVGLAGIPWTHVRADEFAGNDLLHVVPQVAAGDIVYGASLDAGSRPCTNTIWRPPPFEFYWTARPLAGAALYR